jgi:hypothetical protein
MVNVTKSRAGKIGGRAGSRRKKRLAGYIKRDHGIGFFADRKFAQQGGRAAGRIIAAKLAECPHCGAVVTQLMLNRWHADGACAAPPVCKRQ